MLPLRVFAVPACCALLTAGCASFTGYPQPVGDPDGDVAKLNTAYFEKDVLQEYVGLSGHKRREYRDQVVYGRIRAYDIQFREFEKALASQTGATYITTDFLAATLTGLSATVGDQGTKTALAVASGGVIGAKGSIDKDLFYQKTMPALLAQMDAERLKVRADIMAGLATDDDHYPLPKALSDLERYISAGSLPGAIAGIVKDAGGKTQDAEHAITGVTRDAVFLQFQSLFDIQGDRLDKLDADQIKEVAKTMRPLLGTRSEDVRKDVEPSFGGDKYLTDADIARDAVTWWETTDDRSAITLQQWSDAIDHALQTRKPDAAANHQN